MPKQGGIVDIGLNVDYQKSLQEMTNAFKAKLTSLSNEFKKIDFSKDVTQQFDAVYKKIDDISAEVHATFDAINNGKLDTSEFSKYQEKITKEFEKIQGNIDGFVGQISALDKKLNTLSVTNVANDMIKQFDALRSSVIGSYGKISEVFELVNNFSLSSAPVDLNIIQQVNEYKKALNEIQQAKNDAEFPVIDTANIEKAVGIYKELAIQLESLEDRENELFDNYKEDSSSAENLAIERELFVVRQKIVDQLELMSELYGQIGAEHLSGFSPPGEMAFDKSEIDKYIKKATEFIKQNEKMAESYKETQSQAKAAVTEFKVKDGAIHIPIELDKVDSNLKLQLQDIIKQLQKSISNKPIIATVKLTLDGSSSKGYKTNSALDTQQQKGQKEPAIDISKSIRDMHRKAARETEQAIKQSIKQIQDELAEVKVKITPEAEAFTADLLKMVESSLEKVSKEGFKLNVNTQLEKLVSSLKEASMSLSGNENFKLGLDEDSINRITTAIDSMANMIKRAFGVATDNDIESQWASIEEKFKSVAGEQGKLLIKNKDHKVAIQELAIEYKKYLDMGGTNELSGLTKHTQTIKNIAKAYDNLGKSVQETTQKQEKQKATSRDTNVDTEAIRSTTRANKSLETQADKTSTALENEGKSAQSASEKFRKLAKEKGAAVVANRELAKAAKETADALEREAKVRKESGSSKPNKNAVGEETYINNALKWQKDIQQSLLNSGDYEEVYGAKISQSAKGVVQFTASVRTAENEWKKFTATVDASGNISSPKLQDLTEKQVISIERAKEAMQKYLDMLATAEGEGDVPTSYNREELEKYITTIIEANDALDKFKIKKITLNDDGTLSIATEFKDATGHVQTFVAKFDDVRTVINAISDSTSSLGEILESSFDSGKVSATIKDFSHLGEILNKEQTFNNINDVKNNLNSLLAGIGKVNEKSIRIKNMNTLTADIKQANGEIHKMTINLDGNGFARFVDNGISQFGRLREAAESVFKGIKSLVRIYLSPQDFIRYFRQGFDEVKEIDTSMTELRKVSDASPRELATYFDEAVGSAKELGSSVNDMISATADWSRMGYNLPDSKKLGEVAVLYKNVGDGIDIDEANSSLVSTLQGFQMEASEAERIIDSFNEVSNNFAISSGGIGEALKRSAAAFNVANTDLNKSIALVTATNEVIQNPEKVGTLYQTVSARIRGAKAELEEMGGDTDDMVESTSKLRDLVKSMTDFDIMEDENTYKDIYEIIMGIGQEWDKLKDIDRAALLEALAGKRQSNALAAVLGNLDNLEKAYHTAENSAGSAQREQEKYTESLQYSLDQLTAHGEEFWSTFIDNEDVKKFIDILNTLISAGSKIVDTFGSIPTLSFILGGFASIKNVGINMLVAYLLNLYCFKLPTI